ncbi:flagellar biosynthesis protein FlgL [Croceicoccus hydrothermalis]|uniref:flagellin N-terminal helical domain-containing protein n=1 Tax=Croceicoccus hydrothermalis TaxID=2867964 RepID=UPI001EFB5ED6|nr:flagellar biosynthesis protein FlgL [Croceicoccus hydrothermalis]
MTYGANITSGTSAFFNRSRIEMGTLRKEAERMQAQLATGERIERSSDDPVAASRLRSLMRADRLAEIDASNAARAANDLSYADTALQNIAGDLIRARELAVWASSDTMSEEQRRLISGELLQLHEGMVANANARTSTGHAAFGGAASGQAYEIDATGAAVYVGTNDPGVVELGEGQRVTRGVTGPQFAEFTIGGTTSDIFAVVRNLAEAMLAGAGSSVARDSLAAMDAGLESITRAQTAVGTRVAWIETVQDRQVASSVARAEESDRTGGVDVASAITQLQQLMLVLEGSQAGFARLSQLTLFDAIR